MNENETVSRYNIEVEHSGGMLLYNALTDKLLPISFKEYAINYNGKVFKCTARDYGDDKVIGNLQPSGQIKWNENILSKMFEKATFENEMCESCKMLPLCMGSCIQKNYEARINGMPLTCIYKNVEYSLSNYIIDMAKKRSLIQ